MGEWPPWVLAVIAAGLLAPAPALADEAALRFQDEDALLVGDPSGFAAVHTDQVVAGQEVDVGTYKEYSFPVDPPANRLEIDLAYDAGDVGVGGPCLKANDLDLFVEGPGWSRSYPGCDGGGISILAHDVPTGPYTLRVEADQGSTVCIPDDPSSCALPGAEYRLTVTVWQLG